jgi:hypothetical protein
MRLVYLKAVACNDAQEVNMQLRSLYIRAHYVWGFAEEKEKQKRVDMNG